jgi:cell division initiation protein
MALTPLEIREYPLKKGLMGYGKRDVEAFRDICIEAITDATREISDLRDDARRTAEDLKGHERREAVLKDTITTAQQMVDDLKSNAKKEAELIVAEAHHQADKVIDQGHNRVLQIQGEISQLKRQRKEVEIALKSVLEHHAGLLALENKEAEVRDTEAEKLTFLHKK